MNDENKSKITKLLKENVKRKEEEKERTKRPEREKKKDNKE